MRFLRRNLIARPMSVAAARAEAVQVVRVQIVADPDAAHRRRASAAAHDGVADLLLRLPVQDLVRVRVPDTAGWRNPVDSVMIW